MPVLNVFRMFSKMGGERVAVTSDGAVPLDDDRQATACASGPTSRRWRAAMASG